MVRDSVFDEVDRRNAASEMPLAVRALIRPRRLSPARNVDAGSHLVVLRVAYIRADVGSISAHGAVDAVSQSASIHAARACYGRFCVARRLLTAGFKRRSHVLVEVAEVLLGVVRQVEFDVGRRASPP